MKEADDGDGTLTYEAGNDDSLMMIMIMFDAPLMNDDVLFVGKIFCNQGVCRHGEKGTADHGRPIEVKVEPVS